jgi:hypothetical protein
LHNVCGTRLVQKEGKILETKGFLKYKGHSLLKKKEIKKGIEVSTWS